MIVDRCLKRKRRLNACIPDSGFKLVPGYLLTQLTVLHFTIKSVASIGVMSILYPRVDTSFEIYWNQSKMSCQLKCNLQVFVTVYHLMSNPSTTSDEMTSASKQHTHLINLVRGMVPPLTSKLHKGQAGTLPSSCW
jgi:hypothetical protein